MSCQPFSSILSKTKGALSSTLSNKEISAETSQEKKKDIVLDFYELNHIDIKEVMFAVQKQLMNLKEDRHISDWGMKALMDGVIESTADALQHNLDLSKKAQNFLKIGGQTFNMVSMQSINSPQTLKGTSQFEISIVYRRDTGVIPIIMIDSQSEQPISRIDHESYTALGKEIGKILVASSYAK